MSVVVLAFVQPSHGDITFSTEQDFEQGVFINLYNEGHALQINDWQRTKTADPPVLPYLWVACSQRGTVVRIATEEHCSPVDGRWVQAGEILGEYRTAPDGCGAGVYGFHTDPSRTSVDFDGNVWVANRADILDPELGTCGYATCGHVVKIGSGLAYQWVDRNCNGVLDTSTRLADIRPWPNPDGLCMADDALYTAKRAGRNRVQVAGRPDESNGEPTSRAGAMRPQTLVG